MAPLLEIDADARELLAALDRLGDRAEQYCLEAARETGKAVAREAESRLRRQLGPLATGKTADAIAVKDAPKPLGGVWVLVEPQPMRPANLPLWLEVGTWKMNERPHLFVSARLEETAHRRRLEDAVQRAIDSEGLGS
jgi:hypothetical protein